ncbi:MAG TPA: VWA domain-containing protein [Stellaceae bacterium]|nr:VWA domain-containing protein [Stellaceae bacterium]
MNAPVLKFLQAARQAGIRVSAAEGIEAMRAVECVGFEDRQTLKDSLSLVLAKSRDEKALFEECFELYFHRHSLTLEAPEEAAPVVREAAAPLARLLEAGDRAGLQQAIEAAGEGVGVSEIRFFTQTNLFARRMLDAMGLEALDQEIEHRPEGEAGRLKRARSQLFDEVHGFVERQLALFARGVGEQIRDEVLQRARLSSLDRRDFERMRVIVRAMARRLATRYGRERKRKRRGHLDVRRTLRRNMPHDGIPFITVWKSRKIEKPRVVALCDVSGSVASVAQFLLLFLYSLNEALADIRSFAFSGEMIEVSDILEKDTIEDAIARILKEIGFRSSDYGSAFAGFAATSLRTIDRKTSVIVIGDARGNNTDPRTDLFRALASRARRVIWLNPEHPSAWGTGDSDMFRYAPYCHKVAVCNTVRHLERVLEDLLEG